MSRRKKRKQSVVPIILIIIGFIIMLAIVIGLVYFQFTNSKKSKLDDRLCPINSAIAGHYVIVIDQTDPYTNMQKESFKVRVQQLIRHVPQNYLVSLYTFNSQINDHISPVIDLCNPGNGDDLSEFTDNVNRIKKRYSDNFLIPMEQTIDQIETSMEDNNSPIFEALQLVNLYTFIKDPNNIEKKLIIVSDLIHNTKDISMYKMNNINFNNFKKSFLFQKLKTDLSGVHIKVLLLNRRPDIQNLNLINFWEQYFLSVGALLESIEPLEG